MRNPRIAGVTALVLVCACAAPKDEPASKPALIEFELFADPSRGVFDLVDMSVRGLLAANVVQDGVAGSGPINSLEVETTNVATDPGGGACGPPSSFCADVVVRSFYEGPLTDVFAQIVSITPLAGHGPIDSDPPAFGLSNTLGLWGYMTLAGGGASSRRWTFADDGTAFRIRGRVMASLCGNGIQDGDEEGIDCGGSECVLSCGGGPDADGDGSPAGVDCNDNNPDIFPGAAEACHTGCTPDGIDDDCDSIADDGCPVLHSGAITADQTWSAGPHHVCGNVTLDTRGVTLTIEDGANVTFAPATRLRIGWFNGGALDVSGSVAGVLFDAAGSGGPGSWHGVQMGTYTEPSTITGLAIRNAGGDAAMPGALVVRGHPTAGRPAPLLDGLLIERSARNGLWIAEGRPALTDSTIRDNAGFGLSCDTIDGCLSAFSNNVLTGNTSGPAFLHVYAVGFLDNASTYTGNGVDRIQTMGASVRASATWRALGVPIVITENVAIAHASAPVLTIEDGAVLLFDPNAGFRVGQTNRGDLVIDGDRATGAGVRLTALVDSGPGSWLGLQIGTLTTAATRLGGFELELAGATAGQDAGIYVGGMATIEDCDIHDNLQRGIWSYNSSRLTLRRCQVRNTSSGGGAYDGIGVRTGSFAIIQGWAENTITGNDAWPVSIDDPEDMRMLDSASTYAGNGRDEVRVERHVGGGVVRNARTSAVWQALDVPWYIAGELFIHSCANEPVISTFGATFRLERDARIVVGTTCHGDFVAVGCTFTSAQPVPQPGDWKAIGFHSLSTPISGVHNSVLEYGGQSYRLAPDQLTEILVSSSFPSITNNLFRFSAGHGLQCVSGGGSVAAGNSGFMNLGSDVFGCPSF